MAGGADCGDKHTALPAWNGSGDLFWGAAPGVSGLGCTQPCPAPPCRPLGAEVPALTLASFVPAETSSAHTLDLSGELSWALGEIFDSQRGCDLFIQVRGQEEEEQAVCAHTLILAANPEARALQQEPGSNLTMNVDSECLPQVQDFLR